MDTSVVGRPEVYPWPEWANGEVHTINPREEFSFEPEKFVSVLRNRAAYKSLRVKVKVLLDGTVQFQFSKKV
jgi:hypothetical protein